jgi:hypothetical protein
MSGACAASLKTVRAPSGWVEVCERRTWFADPRKRLSWTKVHDFPVELKQVNHIIRTFMQLRTVRRSVMSTHKPDPDIFAEKFYLPATAVSRTVSRVEEFLTEHLGGHGVVLIPDTYND